VCKFAHFRGYTLEFHRQVEAKHPSISETMRRSLLRLAEHASHHAHPAGGVGSAPHVHEPAPFFRYSAIALGASTWFWILYKAKNEGAVLLVCPRCFLSQACALGVLFDSFFDGVEWAMLILGLETSMGSWARAWRWTRRWTWRSTWGIALALPVL